MPRTRVHYTTILNMQTIMKKITLLLLGLLALHTAASADNDERAIPMKQLPKQAQQFVKTYFNDLKTAMITQETDLFDKSYEVVFMNGDRIEFDRNGAWTEVKCRSGQAVPAAIVPEPIQNYVHDWDASVTILGIERDKYSYEVQLSNRWELTFDRNFNVIDIDD